jgi:hypothetical protein
MRLWPLSCKDRRLAGFAAWDTGREYHETVSNLGGCRPLVRAADRVDHRESGMIRVAMTYRLCPPPGLRRFRRRFPIATWNTPCSSRRVQSEGTSTRPHAIGLTPSNHTLICTICGSRVIPKDHCHFPARAEHPTVPHAFHIHRGGRVLRLPHYRQLGRARRRVVQRIS